MHIQDFQLFLFDMDGLLIDTEPLHLLAYKTLCQNHGCTLEIDLLTYCSIAHKGSQELKDFLLETFPSLREISWDTLKKEKKEIAHHLLKNTDLTLMPGVEPLLRYLQEKGKDRCVVTNTSLQDVEIIKKKLPILETIPHWITRESYKYPKPHPEGYHKAISTYGKGKSVIGFEDSIRGFLALAQTTALPVLICSPHMPYAQGITNHFSSLEEYFSTCS